MFSNPVKANLAVLVATEAVHLKADLVPLPIFLMPPSLLFTASSPRTPITQFKAPLTLLPAFLTFEIPSVIVPKSDFEVFKTAFDAK